MALSSNDQAQFNALFPQNSQSSNGSSGGSVGLSGNDQKTFNAIFPSQAPQQPQTSQVGKANGNFFQSASQFLGNVFSNIGNTVNNVAKSPTTQNVESNVSNIFNALGTGAENLYHTVLPGASSAIHAVTSFPIMPGGLSIKDEGNIIDALFKLPDQAINATGDAIYNASKKQGEGTANLGDNIVGDTGNVLAWIQKNIEQPVFESNPLTRGIQRGVAQMYLGSSKDVQKTFNTPLDKTLDFSNLNKFFQQPDMGGRTASTVGDLAGTVLSFIAGGEVLKGLQLGKLAMPVLFATLGQTSSSPDTTAVQRLEKLPVDAIAGWLFSKIPGGENILSKATATGAIKASAITGGQGLVDNIIQGMKPQDAAKAAGVMAVIGGLFHIGGSATGLLTKSDYKQGVIDMTPEEARNQVLNTDLKGTPAGEAIMHASMQAEEAGKNLRIAAIAAKQSPIAGALNLDTPNGINFNIQLVDAPAQVAGEANVENTAENQQTTDNMSETPANAQEGQIAEEPKAPPQAEGFAQDQETAPTVSAEEQPKSNTTIRVPDEFRSPTEETAFTHISSNPDQIKQDYITKFGNEVNPDLALQLLPDYQGHNSGELSRASGTIKELVYNDLLKTEQGKRNNTVLISAGGSGSGKTTHIGNKTALKDTNAIVVDTTFSHNSALKDVKKALDNGYDAHIHFVLRDPKEAWSNGVLPRTNSEGRVISEGYFLRSHVDAIRNILKTWDKYRDDSRVHFTLTENTADGAHEIPIDKVTNISYDRQALAEHIKSATDKSYETAQITKEQYEATRSDREELERYASQSERTNSGEKAVATSEQDEQLANDVREAYYSGDPEAAKALYDSFVEGGSKLPSFESISQEMDSAIEQSKQELEDISKEIRAEKFDTPDSPNYFMKEIADKLMDHFNRPYAKLKITGKERVYSSESGKSMVVGGTGTEAFDRLINATDIEGFKKNIGILHEKFDKVFTELYSGIRSGNIDGADYEEFKNLIAENQASNFRLRRTANRQSVQSRSNIKSSEGKGNGSEATVNNENSNTSKGISESSRSESRSVSESKNTRNGKQPSEQQADRTSRNGNGLKPFDPQFFDETGGDYGMSRKQVEDMLNRYYQKNKDIYGSKEEFYSLEPHYMAMDIESDSDMYFRYLKDLPEDTDLEDILTAYNEGKLSETTEGKKTTPEIAIKKVDAKPMGNFYEPKEKPTLTPEKAQSLYQAATQQSTKATKPAIAKARMQLFIAHNTDASLPDKIGISKADMNKKIRTWSNYSADSVRLYNQVNGDKSVPVQWDGIINSNFLAQADVPVTPEEFDSFVKEVDNSEKTNWYGDGERLREYITRTFLAVDTRISYKDLTIKTSNDFERDSIQGDYNATNKTIRIKNANVGRTVAHEIGHYLDHKWGQELYGGANTNATEVMNSLNRDYINEKYHVSPERWQWHDRFHEFVDQITENSNLGSEYHQRRGETFARFVAKFVDWVNVKAGGWDFSSDNYSDSQDNFHSGQYTKFIRLLQEKAYVDIQDGNPYDATKSTEQSTLGVVGEEKADEPKDNALQTFFSGEIEPAYNAVKEVGNEWSTRINPPRASDKAAKTANLIREAKSKIANYQNITIEKYHHYQKYFNKFNDAQNIANISSYERTGAFKNQPDAGYSQLYHDSLQEAYKVLAAAYGKDADSLIENYVRRQFVFGSKADEAKGTTYLGNYAKSLSGSKSPLQHRVLDMPLDEALANMKERGINVRMATTNPEALRQWSLVNAQRALAYKQAWNDAKASKFITFVPRGGQIPDGYIRLEDRAAEVFAPAELHFPSGQGENGLEFQDKGYQSTITMGRYYADPNVARVFNNAISSGLEGSATFRGIRFISNSMNMFQLGISGFHFTAVGIDAGVTDISIGIRYMLSGKPIKALSHTAIGVIPFASFTKDMVHGHQLLEGLKDNSPQAYDFLKSRLNPAGGRLGQDAHYRNDVWDKISHAWKNNNPIGAGVRTAFYLPPALIELVGHPLLNFAIPRVKLGAFMDLAESRLSRLPSDATDFQRRQALVSAWTSIDNRMGQLVYDNLFWNKAGKDVAMLVTRSVGWNLGTVRELGGAVIDAGGTIRGKGISDRMLWGASLVMYVALLSAIYMYLHTGQMPKELKDYFHPKNGLVDKNGNPDRVNFPSYMKDVFAYLSDPLGTVMNKTSPFINTIAELIGNKDYYGNLIRNPNDPAGTQLSQVGSYVLQNILPFSVQQFNNQLKLGANPEQLAESFFGIIKAPQSVIRSDAQNNLQKAYQNQVGLPAPKTPEQQATATLKAQARDEIMKNGWRNSPAFHQLMNDGTLKTQRQRLDFIKSAKLTTQQRMLQRIPKASRAQFLQNAQQ